MVCIYHTRFNMTIGEIFLKISLSNMKKYKLFVLCNLASIAVLYSFIAISTNKQFMNPLIVNPQISGNIYAPTFFILIFMAMFIPYSQNVLIKAGQKDHGILLSLGMEKGDGIKIIVIENLVLYIVSLILGLILGTTLSLFFWRFVRKLIGISNIDITFSISAYRITALYVSIIFAVSLIINACCIIKSTIYDKIKYTEKAESGKHYSIVFCIAGIIITIVDFIAIIISHSKNDNIWLIRIFICIVGSLLIFYNGEALIEYFKNKCHKRYLKDIFLFSDMKYYYNKNKKIFFVNTWLVFGILFVFVLSILNYPALIKDSSTYHPFHMAYCEIKGNFQALKDSEIDSIAENNSNSIITSDAVSFARNNFFTIFCVDDINRIFKTDYNVQANSFIYVHPYDINDNYEHEDIKNKINNVDIKYEEETKKFVIEDTVINPLFGQVNCVSSNILLANKEDYERISLKSTEFRIQGVLHLYNFANWRSSKPIVDEVTNRLFGKNTNIEKTDRFYQISSRIEAYNTAIQSTNFLIFIFIYVWIVLYFSYIIMIHFKLQMEYEGEKRKYFSLFRIGISEIEIKKIMSKKILVVYFIPLIYGIIISVMFCTCFFTSYGYGCIGILAAIIVSIIFSLIHAVVYKLYFMIYYGKIINSIILQ